MDSTLVRAALVVLMYSFGMYLVFRRPASRNRRIFQISLAVIGGLVLLFVIASRFLLA